MKKYLLTLVVAACALCAAQPAAARGVIIYSNGEQIDVIENYPAEVVVNEDEHVNLGVYFQQFSIFWVPMWNYGETKFVLVNDAEDTYYDLEADDIEYLKSEFGIEVPEKPVIGFWHRIGGKIIWGIVLIGLIWIWWVTRNVKDEEQEQEDSTIVPGSAAKN